MLCVFAVIQFEFFHLCILCGFVPFDSRVSWNCPIIYQYSPIKKTSVEKNIFDIKIVNILFSLCQTYLFVLNSVFRQSYELTSRN